MAMALYQDMTQQQGTGRLRYPLATGSTATETKSANSEPAATETEARYQFCAASTKGREALVQETVTAPTPESTCPTGPLLVSRVKVMLLGATR